MVFAILGQATSGAALDFQNIKMFAIATLCPVDEREGGCMRVASNGGSFPSERHARVIKVDRYELNVQSYWSANKRVNVSFLSLILRVRTSNLFELGH